jgi:protein phosphatase
VLRQLSVDHSLVAEVVRLGMLGAHEAQHAPFRNVLSRSLGSSADCQVELIESAWRWGDTLLLCSDGLHGCVEDSVIEATLVELGPNAAARALVKAANEAGGPDNVTVVVVRCETAG